MKGEGDSARVKSLGRDGGSPWGSWGGFTQSSAMGVRDEA